LKFEAESMVNSLLIAAVDCQICQTVLCCKNA